MFRRVSSAGKAWGDGVTEKLAWHVVKEFAEKTGVSKLAPHDLRRSCARPCRAAGGELEQIQFLLGHVSVQTTERYPWLHPTDLIRGQRPHRDRAENLNDTFGRVGDDSPAESSSTKSLVLPCSLTSC